ncbi:MAG: TolB family protein, partial [Terriglobales bacterium]
MRRAARAAGTGLIGGVLVLAAVLAAAPAAAAKPPLTFRKFFHAVSFAAVQVAPDGSAVVIETNRADYAHNRFRTDLWIYSIAGNGQGGELAPLATGGYAGSPQWSPNSRWVAFLSGRAGQGRQLYVIPARGGAAAMLSAIPGGVHAYSWGTDSRTLYFAAKTPLTAAQIAAHKQKWHDVIRYDRDLRGDSIYRVTVPAADAFNSEPPAKFGPGALGATLVAKVYYRVGQLLATNDGRRLIYDTRSRRGPIWVNGYKHKQIFALTLAPRAGTPGGLAADPAATRWTRDRAIADRLRLPVAGGGLFFAASSNIPG